MARRIARIFAALTLLRCLCSIPHAAKFVNKELLQSR